LWSYAANNSLARVSLGPAKRRPPKAYPLWKSSVKIAPAGKTMFNQDFKEFIESLNDNQVRYLLIGETE
jgi:hypothetical protein